ncbi:MAG: PKD domain-containing protein [Lewinellaceae bacterium]|nr:PKD domain-containing protein [Lewinellaceae bacterium]
MICQGHSICAQSCQAAFAFGETGLTIDFTDASTSLAGDPVISWFWDFEDGSTSTAQNPSHTFPDANTYDVCLSITTQSGCTSEACIRIEICQLEVSVSVGACDANGEIPLIITVNDLFDNARDINIAVDGGLLPGGPFRIRIGQPVIVNATVPGDGLIHEISVQSEDIGTCAATYNFSVPDCTSNCFLSGLNVNLSGGVTHVVQIGDNFFSPENTTITIGDAVEFQWVGDGHSTTSDATTGPDSWNSGVIGFGSVFTVNIINPGVHGYYCIPHGGPNGQGMSGIIVANCPASGNFTLEVSFNTSIAGPEGYGLLLDGAPVQGSPFNYSGTGPQSNTISIAGDGAMHVVKIQDVADSTCFVSQAFSAPDCGIAPACSISVLAGQAGGCSVAGEVPVELSVNAINGGASGFNIYIDGNLAPGSPFIYNSSGPAIISINVPGDGQNHVIEARDNDDAACTGSATLTTQDCSINCAITNLLASTGTSTVHTVLVEDFAFNPRNITIASGDVVEWQWVGSVAHTSTSDAPSGPDSWNSGLLSQGATYQSPVLSTGVHPYYCIPHGAPGGIGMSGSITVQADCTNEMVSVEVAFTGQGGGFNGYEVLVDNNTAGTFGYSPDGNNIVSVLVPGDGQGHTLTVRDVDDPGCIAGTTITTPDCNSASCQLSLSVQETGGCSENNELPVELTVNNIGGGAAGFEVMVDGVVVDSFAYSGNATIVSVNVAGDGQEHNIEVRDIETPACTASTTLITTDCSQECAITNLELSVSDAGNPVTHVVEVRDFEFVPSALEVRVGDVVRFEWVGVIAHTSTSDATTGPDSWNSGLLTQGDVFEVTIITEGEHPYYCIPHGAPGGVGMSGMITATPPCDGGNVVVNLSFDAIGGNTEGYNVFIDGEITQESPYLYANNTFNSVPLSIPGDGQQHTVLVQDALDTICTAERVILVPDCGQSMPCSLALQAVVSGACNEEGQVPVELTVITAGTGNNGFVVLVDGNPYQPVPFSYGPTDTTILEIQVTGTGGERLVEVRDIDSTTCVASSNIMTPLCGPLCEVQGLTVNSGQPGRHLVEVKDFEFYPAHIQVLVGDTVEFIWKGEMPHTSTSDAITGTNSWDSGLLGQGASYEVVITEAGLHPYYCIPHGGPGGIGMSGEIEAVGPCNDSMASVTVSFSTTNGSNNGYNIFLDGEHLAGPILYTNDAGYNSTLINIPGDSAQHVLTIQDMDVSFCAASTLFTAPACNIQCLVGNLAVSFPESGRHLVEVKDFEFLPKELNVTAGDTVAFFWTGEMAHTTTSDATSGVDSWDSGLLGQGADFEVVIHEPGAHPYYCIPHGAPGGIGMAGMITAAPACQGDSVLASISFEGVGGNGGFQLSLDGENIGQFDYQPGILNELEVLFFGDGNEHELAVLDIENPGCSDTVRINVPQCAEPCAGLLPGFSVVFDEMESLRVQFVDQTEGTVHQWLWGFGDGATSNAQNPFHTYEQPGVYTVCLLAQDTLLECNEATCRELQLGVTDTREPLIRAMPLKIFPNPAWTNTTRWMVEGLVPADYSQPVNYVVFSLRGERIAEGTERGSPVMSVPLQAPVPPGMYLLELRSSSGNYIGKMIIQ